MGWVEAGEKRSGLKWTVMDFLKGQALVASGKNDVDVCRAEHPAWLLLLISSKFSEEHICFY